VLFIGTLLLGLLLQLLAPHHLANSLWYRIGGGVLFLLSGPLAIWAQQTMKRAGTNVLPGQPSLTIVTHGPFRFSRNPIYLANSFAYLGLTLVFNTPWPLLLILPMLAILYWGVIRREERYLEAKFGDPYLIYKARVRRWI
jgi:protein-S-isoprenylcysteine O-methyltransferase Ste14